MSLASLISSVVINDAGFGPSADHLPPQFKDIPYAPFSKNDKLGRVVDWNAEGTSSGAAPSSGPAAGGAAPRQQGGKYGREPKEAFGASSAGTFAYFHEEDEASFSVVSGGAGAKKAGQQTGGGLANRGQQNRQGGQGGQRGQPARPGQPGAAGARGAPAQGGARGGQQARPAQQQGKYQRPGQGGRGNWKDWNKPDREASVAIGADWQPLEEVEFSRLNKLRFDVDIDEVETLSQHGFLYEYDRTFDKINTKNEKPLQVIERVRYNPSTSDDPVIQELAAKDKAQIFVTDSILSMLMTTQRSVYPWDIVLTREGDKLFFDKREGGPFDYPSVNENAADPPAENEKESLNTPSALSLEATYINQNYAFQVVREDPDARVELEHPNPFYQAELESEPLASCGFRYRKFNLSITEDEDVSLVVRTEVDAYTKANPNDDPNFITIKTLNEFDSRAQGSGGAPDWRTKLDSQRGAVVATEMKNNSSKLARWAVQSILAGAEQMKMGYVTRLSPRDASRHTILGSQWYKPRDFAAQLNVNLGNGWGIVRTIADLALKQPEGKYVLLRDPNKPSIRFYRVPNDAFEPTDDGDFETSIPSAGASDNGLGL